MDKIKKIKILSAVSIIGTILAITVAFALITRSMVINGSGNVKPALWDIHFKDISSPTITGGASVITEPTVADKGAKIDNLEVRLTLPQDKIEYTVYIENSGNMNAKIDDIKYPTLTEEESKIFKFSAKYEKDGTPMQVGDTLYKGQTKKVIITIEYLDISDKNLLPKETKTIDIDFKIKYVQDNNSYADEVQALLPDGYKECEYLESDGNQRITFNTLLPSGTTAEFVSSVNNTGTYQTIFGNGLQRYLIEVYYTNAKVGVWQQNSGMISLISDTGNNEINTIHKTKVVLLIDIVGTKSLFSYNERGSYPLSGRIYSAIFTNSNNKHIHYFVPCLDENDKPCMYDTISGVTFYNKGTGEFNYQLKQ
ncbi:MAG: hypothetical protein IJ094_08480 [Bacilli bacterium]|nr:hypothetical protein [Bacilli bacterium]